MRIVLAVVGLMAVSPYAAATEDRVEQFETLVREYEIAANAFFEAAVPDEMTTAEQIRRYESFSGWRYLPRFVELAESEPSDEVAFRCCQWIIDRTENVDNRDKLIYYADQKAWEILAAHHTGRADLPMLSLRAMQYYGPARERFLRGLLMRQDLSRDGLGFATIALAELVKKKHGLIEDAANRPSFRSEFEAYLKRRESPDRGKDLVPANAATFKAEAVRLFHDVLMHYADVAVTIAAPGTGFRSFKNLGEKASQSLHALEHLSIGSEAPNIVGKDLNGVALDLSDHKGKVVVISFWFTGCGACMGLIPQERSLIEAYQRRPFALLGVCTDETMEQAQQTAAEHGIDWPCWFDGQNGPIARDWNVLGWPTIYVLDQRGRIVAKNLRGPDLDAMIKELMDKP